MTRDVLNVPRYNGPGPIPPSRRMAAWDEVEAGEVDVPDRVRVALVDSGRVDYATASTLTLQDLFDLLTP